MEYDWTMIKFKDAYFDERKTEIGDKPSNLAPNKWLLPSEIKLQDAFLVWRDHERAIIEPSFNEETPGIVNIVEPLFKETPNTEDNHLRLFNNFIKLANESKKRFGEKVEAFARHYGVLGICSHGMPHTHQKSQGLLDSMPKYCRENLEQNGWILEPLDRWRYYSQLVATIISIAKSLDSGRSATLEELAFVTEIPEEVIRRVVAREKQAIKRDSYIGLSLAVDKLLEITDVRPRFWWDEHVRGFQIQGWRPGWNVLSAITVQLMLFLNNSSRISTCTNCGNDFALRRFQSIRKNVFCENCNEPGGNPLASWNRASKKRYQKDKENPNREKQKRKKLNKKQVEVIRKEWGKWDKPGKPVMQFYNKFADKYGVSERSIRKIINRETWEEV
jgi:hypothetical protein